ncbi:hypothetical protein OAR97_08155, partial [Arcobacteraceae bacterium]|nr:hypothetical protein [Arcobacteraceae bacterium]
LNRVNIYDKYKKHKEHRDCTLKYKNWHRVENTYTIKQKKLDESVINKIVDNAICISNDYFGVKNYDDTKLQKQLLNIL